MFQRLATSAWLFLLSLYNQQKCDHNTDRGDNTWEFTFFNCVKDISTVQFQLLGILFCPSLPADHNDLKDID